jgi:hypothetical protein
MTELQQFHHVFVASEKYAAKLAGRLQDRVSPLLQCADPEVFRPGVEHDVRDQVLFVGNTRGQRRAMVNWALQAGFDFRVFGRGWGNAIPSAYFGGDFIPNEMLAAYYGNGNIVLNDHWPDMAAEGFLSNRLFDAAAAGATIISDEADGLSAVFGELITICRSPEELRAAVAAAMREPRTDSEHSRALRQLILERHTFVHRAAEIIRIVHRLVGVPATALSATAAHPAERAFVA